MLDNQYPFKLTEPVVNATADKNYYQLKDRLSPENFNTVLQVMSALPLTTNGKDIKVLVIRLMQTFLEVMIKSGDPDATLGYIFSEIENAKMGSGTLRERLDELLNEANNSLIGMERFTQELKEYLANVAEKGFPVVGPGAIDTPDKMVDGVVNRTKLADDFTYSGFITDGHINDLLKTGEYVLNNTVSGLPFSSAFFLSVGIYGGRFTQILRPLDNPARMLVRGGSIGSIVTLNFKEVVNTQPIANEMLAEDYLLRPNIPNGTDLNTYLKSSISTIMPNGNYINLPNNFNSAHMGILTVLPLVKNGNVFYLQKIISYTDPSKSWVRNINNNAKVFGEWKSLALDSTKDLQARTNLTSGTDIQKINFYGKYLGIGSYTYANIPKSLEGKSFMLDVDIFGTTGGFRRYTITPLNEPTNIWTMYLQETSTTPISTDWKYIGASGNILTGKTVVHFGDSIFGNVDGIDSISGVLGTLTGATALNCGFGGCRMSQHSQHWDAFSMYRLADSIVNGDWSLQDTAIAANVSGMPSYFKLHLDLLKSMDWTKVDYITVGYGTNDYTASVTIENADNKFDTTTYAGALRYSLEKLLTKYPHIKILVTTPTYRFWTNEDGSYKEDSDNTSFNVNQDKLIAYVAKAIEIADEYKLDRVDLYRKLGINKFNRTQYFPANDGTHHNANGRKRIAEKLAGALNTY
ncbi:SGNH/GDSL hydrolase family protein [Globicatella sulfidifaciens]